ncbi:MAG: chloride channel protein [Eubacteriaceae bacterium]|nr:chloride channel protein [Eubacteriaceae bacterium]
MKNKIKNTALFVIFAFILGAAAGAIVWVVLKIISVGIDFIWTWIPERTGHETLYTIGVCLVGGLIIGLYQKKFGILPETLETVMARLKKEGTYDYSRLHILTIAAILPLIFGGSLGPEAGLTGLIVGLCCWIGDRFKYKIAEIRELAMAGMAATLGIIFNAPLFGLINNFEGNDDEEEPPDREPVFSEKTRKVLKPVIYAICIAGGFLTLSILKHFMGGGLGIPRFETVNDSLSIRDWIWMAVFIAAGIIAGCFYVLIDKITKDLAACIEKKRILSCLIAGGCLAAFGLILPMTMFSGEEQMGDLMDTWMSLSAVTLLCTAVGKIVLINLCINFGWRGGNIFPLVFVGVSLGYGMVALTGISPVLGIALTTSALCGYVMKKPLAVVGILLLCFPVVFVIPMTASAYIASLVPTPWKKNRGKNCPNRVDNEEK